MLLTLISIEVEPLPLNSLSFHSIVYTSTLIQNMYIHIVRVSLLYNFAFKASRGGINLYSFKTHYQLAATRLIHSQWRKWRD